MFHFPYGEPRCDAMLRNMLSGNVSHYEMLYLINLNLDVEICFYNIFFFYKSVTISGLCISVSFAAWSSLLVCSCPLPPVSGKGVREFNVVKFVQSSVGTLLFLFGRLQSAALYSFPEKRCINVYGSRDCILFMSRDMEIFKSGPPSLPQPVSLVKMKHFPWVLYIGVTWLKSSP